MKKVKTGIFILIALFLVCILCYLIYNLSKKDAKEETIIKDEISKIEKLDYMNDSIDEKIYSKNASYQKVEKAIKAYYKDFYEAKKTISTYRTEQLFNKLTPEFLNSNKSKFASLKLNDKNQENLLEFEKGVDKIISLLNEETIMSYLSQKGLNYYYISYYRSIMTSSKDDDHQEDWEVFKKSNKEKMEYLNEIVSLLENNSGKWYIQNNTFYISDSELLEKYNAAYIKVYDLKEE